MVKETTKYDNFINKVEETNTLAKFIGDIKKVDELVEKKKSIHVHNYKVIYVHFRNIDDFADFCKIIGHVVDYKTREIYYPQHDPDVGLFFVKPNPVAEIDYDLIRPRKKARIVYPTSNPVNPWKEHWKEMPEYEQNENPAFRTLTVKFRKKDHFKEFAKLVDQDLSEKTKTIWHPKLYVTKNRLLRWMQHGDPILPKYPVYIVSKGRHESMGTSRSLSRMQIPHYIIVEPQDMKPYDAALDNFGIRKWVTLIEAPFSNHGDGPGRARNFAWDHSISIGATSHWVLDDNIDDFYRLHQNKRIRFETGCGFKAMEDFVDRYENVPIAGPQYRFFIAPDQAYPPVVCNTRIYSTLLIRNDCKHRWRGRYNEDTDICLRVMKDGDVTVQFNAFMQGKAATQTVSGGNTAEFYHAEYVDNPEKVSYNAKGTINKSKMLVDMHPDVARLVWKYGRWHHHVDYTPFKNNKLRLKPGINLKDEPNNYGMYLIDNYGL